MLYTYKAEMIQKEFNKRITIGEDFMNCFQEEGEKSGLIRIRCRIDKRIFKVKGA